MISVDSSSLPADSKPDPISVTVESSVQIPLAVPGTQSSYETVEMSDDFMRALEAMEEAAMAASQASPSPAVAVAPAIQSLPVRHGSPAPSSASVVLAARGAPHINPYSQGLVSGLPTSSSSSSAIGSGRTATSSSSVSSGTRLPPSATASTLVVCVRLLAVDVQDDRYQRMKSIRCYQIDSNQKTVPDNLSLMTVEVYDEW